MRMVHEIFIGNSACSDRSSGEYQCLPHVAPPQMAVATSFRLHDRYLCVFTGKGSDRAGKGDLRRRTALSSGRPERAVDRYRRTLSIEWCRVLNANGKLTWILLVHDEDDIQMQVDSHAFRRCGFAHQCRLSGRSVSSGTSTRPRRTRA